MREIVIGGAQMGPIQKADSREAVVARMMALLDQAIAAKCDLVVFPELTLTTFFPRWFLDEGDEFETPTQKLELFSPVTHALAAADRLGLNMLAFKSRLSRSALKLENFLHFCSRLREQASPPTLI